MLIISIKGARDNAPSSEARPTCRNGHELLRYVRQGRVGICTYPALICNWRKRECGSVSAFRWVRNAINECGISIKQHLFIYIYICIYIYIYIYERGNASVSKSRTRDQSLPSGLKLVPNSILSTNPPSTHHGLARSGREWIYVKLR